MWETVPVRLRLRVQKPLRKKRFFCDLLLVFKIFDFKLMRINDYIYVSKNNLNHIEDAYWQNHKCGLSYQSHFIPKT